MSSFILLWSRSFSIEGGKGKLFAGTDQITATLIQARFIKDGARQLQQVIKTLKWSQLDPVLVCVQSPKSDSTLRKEFSALSSYPFVRFNYSDSPSIMSGLDWGTVIVKRMIQHFLNSFTVLEVGFHMGDDHAELSCFRTFGLSRSMLGFRLATCPKIQRLLP